MWLAGGGWWIELSEEEDERFWVWDQAQSLAYHQWLKQHQSMAKIRPLGPVKRNFAARSRFSRCLSIIKELCGTSNFWYLTLSGQSYRQVKLCIVELLEFAESLSRWFQGNLWTTSEKLGLIFFWKSFAIWGKLLYGLLRTWNFIEPCFALLSAAWNTKPYHLR